jgi:tetratricopeptide (TPR) repeat protein
VQGASLERLRRAEFVSALSTADSLRQEGAFARAAVLYREFLQDHPDSPQVPDARLRLGLCLEALPNCTEQALATFLETASLHRESPRHVMMAMVHAWACAVRLNRFEEAERYFDAIRSSYDLGSLVAAVPEELLKDLRGDHFRRAGELAEEEPERAARLFETCADIAAYLGDTPQAVQALVAAGLQQLRCGDPIAARELYARAAGIDQAPAALRSLALVRLAEAARLQGDGSEALESYQRALADCPAEDRLAAGWIRLWTGDLLCEQGEMDRALKTWEEGAGAASGLMPGILMRRLADLEYLPGDLPLEHQGEVWFCNARVARLLGDLAGWRDCLQKAADLSPRWQWPGPLARVQLGEEPEGRP